METNTRLRSTLPLTPPPGISSQVPLPITPAITYPAVDLSSVDTFQSSTRNSTSAGLSVADNFNRLYRELAGSPRKQFWSDVVASNMKMNGIQPVMQPEWSLRSESSYQPESVKLVKEIQSLKANEKVDFIRALTGDQSAYTQYAEKVLLQRQTPNAQDMQNLFKPNINNWFSPTAIQTGFSAMAMGLMALPIVLPTLALTQPNALVAIAGQIAISLI